MQHDMTIQMTKTVQPQGGARWLAGAKIHTSAAELEQRGVPGDSYRVLSGPAPGSPVTPEAAEEDPKPARKKK